LKNTIIILLLLFSVSCIKPVQFNPGGRPVSDDKKNEVYIVNSLAETISVIDTSALKIKNDILETGLWPNYISVRNNTGYIVNSGDNSIQIFDEDTLTTVRNINLGANSNPWSLSFYGLTDTGFIPNFVAGNIAVVNLNTGAVLKRISVGTGPEGAVVCNGKLYVANTSWNYETYSYGQGTVAVIDLNSYKVVKIINTDKNPQCIIGFDSINEIHVICTGNNGGADSDDGKIDIIDTSNDTIKQVLDIGGSPGGFAVDYSFNKVYLCGVGGIQVYNYLTRDILHSSTNYLAVGNSNDFFSGLTIDTVNNRIFATIFNSDKIFVLDRFSNKKITELDSSDGPINPCFYGE